MNRKLLLLIIMVVAIVFVASIFLGKTVQKLAYPVQGKITSKFGYRTHPVTGVRTMHNGIDIGVPSGTAVIAPANGTIKSIYSNAQGGNQMIIKHDNGFTTGYAHLSKYSVAQGDKITKGQKIAETGSTGKVTGPHLHLTVRDAEGNLVDPVTVLV
jgi:murein DD-endopeptidase MepM/ murein hydrolase activator NlpD